MLYARKSNRVQPIVEADIQHFLNLGYNIIDEQGNVLLEAMPEDVISLKAAFKRHVEEIAQMKEFIKACEHNMAVAELAIGHLTEENNELKAQVEKAQATKTTKAKKVKKDEEVVEETAEPKSNE